MNNPESSARYVVYVVAVMTFLAGLFVLTPWYLPPEPLGLLAGLITQTNVVVAAGLTCGVCLPGLIGMFTRDYRWTKHGALWLFAFYLFNTLTRILIIGQPGNLLWWPSLIIAAVLMVIYLYDRKHHVHT